jgi:hypothetical protein
MGKAAPDTTLDAMLDEIATATDLHVCSSEPANFAGIAAVTLAEHIMAGGDYTNANGDTNGRKVTIAQQASIAIDTTGTATEISLDDGTDLVYVTTCTSQLLTSGGTVTVPAWDIEIADPT